MAIWIAHQTNILHFFVCIYILNFIYILNENIDEFLYTLSDSKQKSIFELKNGDFWYFIVEICLRYSSAVTVSMTYIENGVLFKNISWWLCAPSVARLCALQKDR